MSQVRKDVLNGWKEIAAYLGRDPRTVERWEKTRALPVRRMPGSGRATVYALTPELDAWLAQPVLSRAEPPSSSSASEAPEQPILQDPVSLEESAFPPELSKPFVDRSRSWLWLGLVCVVVVAAAIPAYRDWRHKGMGVKSAAASVSRDRVLVHPSAVAGVEELFLRGSYQMELRTPESLARAQEAFSEALKRDPSYAPALAGLAGTYLLAREYATAPEDESYEQARKTALKALTLEPDLPQAHAVLGFVNFFWKWNAPQAEHEFLQAIQIDPNLALTHHWYGSMLTHEGRFHEALSQLAIAQRLEPSSSAILTTRALALGLSGHKDESSAMLNDAISLESEGTYRNSATMHGVMGELSLLQPRDIPRFLAENALAADLRRDRGAVQHWEMARETYRAHGERAMWQALLAMEQPKSGRPAPTYALARYQAELGADEEALSTLEALYSRHDPGLIGLSIDPLFLGIRNQARFAKIRTEMGLPRSDAG